VKDVGGTKMIEVSVRGNHGRGKLKPNSIASWFLLAHHRSEQKIFTRLIRDFVARYFA
jgi:hypothetical protein